MLPYGLDRPCGVNHAETARLVACQIEKRLSGALLEFVARGLHAIRVMLQTPVRRRRVHVEQVRAHGHQPAGRPHAQPADVVGGQFTASRLIGERRIKIPVGDHHGSAFQRRTDHFSHVLRPVGGEDQRLRARCDIGTVGFRGVSRLTQQQLTQAAAQCRAARLTRHHDLAACSLQVVTQALDLRGLPYAVNAFERNEQSSHIYPLAHSVRDGGMRRGQAAIAAAAT